MTKEEMLEDIIEYQLNFMDLPTVVSLARKALLSEYSGTTREAIEHEYNQIFNKDIGEIQ